MRQRRLHRPRAATSLSRASTPKDAHDAALSGQAHLRTTPPPARHHPTPADHEDQRNQVTPDSRVHALYRFYAADSTLLYVGITLDPGARWRAHRDDKPWWTEVASITIEIFPSRTEVLAAERVAIIAEHPAYNVIHNRRRPTVRDEHDEIMLSLVGDPFATAWGADAAHMPDQCHDRCVPNGDDSVYYPFFWHAGEAHYLCAAGHHWTCSWSHARTGAAPQNRRTRQTGADA